MQIVFIIIYCLVAVVLLFGITLHDELLNERRRKHTPRLIVIDGGKPKSRRRACVAIGNLRRKSRSAARSQRMKEEHLRVAPRLHSSPTNNVHGGIIRSALRKSNLLILQ